MGVETEGSRREGLTWGGARLVMGGGFKGSLSV